MSPHFEIRFIGQETASPAYYHYPESSGDPEEAIQAHDRVAQFIGGTPGVKGAIEVGDILGEPCKGLQQVYP